MNNEQYEQLKEIFDKMKNMNAGERQKLINLNKKIFKEVLLSLQ